MSQKSTKNGQKSATMNDLNAPKMFGSEPNVQVHSGPEPEPPFRFVFDGLVEPNPEHNVRFGFEHCL
jgi:hypothetical protein